MKRPTPVPTPTNSQDMANLARPVGTVQLDLEKLHGVQSVRREAIADAVREWIIPLLVRRFLEQHTLQPSAESGQDDFSRASQ